jgi:hypothetical protein
LHAVSLLGDLDRKGTRIDASAGRPVTFRAGAYLQDIGIESDRETDFAHATVPSHADDQVIHLATCSLCGAAAVIGTAKTVVADAGANRQCRRRLVGVRQPRETDEPADGRFRFAFALPLATSTTSSSAGSQAHNASASAAASPTPLSTLGGRCITACDPMTASPEQRGAHAL